MSESYQLVKKQSRTEPGRFAAVRFGRIVERAYLPPREHGHRIFMRMPTNEAPPAKGAPAGDIAAWRARMRKLEAKALRTRI